MRNKIVKIFFGILSAFVVVAMLPNAVFADSIATINGTEYSSITEAIADAGANQTTIVLQKDTVESITIPATANITLDLNGKKLENNANQHTIENKGTFRLKSTVSGGIVDNLSDNKAALYNNVGGDVVIDGELTLIKSNDDGTDNLSWYTLANLGMMEVNDGVAVINPGDFTSTVTNGFLKPETYFPDVPYVQLTINGGTFSGGKNAIKNDSGGYLIINGGTITNPTGNLAILNWNVATINGGTFTAKYLIAMGKYDWGNANPRPTIPTEQGKITINGGTFTGEAVFGYATTSNIQTYEMTITGGTFTSSTDIKIPDDATFTVSGGQFNNILPNNTILPDNKEIVLDNNGYYVIVDKSGPTPVFRYEVIEGADQTYVLGSDTDIIIRSNGDLNDLVEIKVDGNTPDTENYKLKSGSTILTLKANYLNTLSAGSHKIEFIYTNGVASTLLNIALNGPNTGFNTNIATIGASANITGLVVMGLLVLAVFGLRRLFQL